MDAKGYYSDTEKSVVYIVINKFQVQKMREIVHSIDKNAYIYVSDVADVFNALQM